MHNLPQLRACDLLFFFVGDFVEKVRLLRDIAGTEKKKTIARQTIAPGTTGFLIIAFDVLRQVVVDHPTDVRFVDAHSKRDRGADNPRVVAKKLLLISGAFRGSEPGMIRPREKST